MVPSGAAGSHSHHQRTPHTSSVLLVFLHHLPRKTSKRELVPPPRIRHRNLPVSTAFKIEGGWHTDSLADRNETTNP